MLYIFCGADTFSRGEALTELKRTLDGGSGMLSTNTTVLDAARTSIEEVLAACDTVPFLGGARLVIVEGLLAGFEGREQEGRAAQRGASGGRRLSADEQSKWLALAAYADRMPPTTHLVLIDDEASTSNSLLRALRRFATVREFGLPRGAALQTWMRAWAEKSGVTLSPPALALLADLIGPNLEMASREIEKLGLYAAGRAVTPEDVRQLTPHAREASVFTMVDAVVEGRSDLAIRLFRELLAAGAPPAYIMAMLVRQYRNLILARDLLSSGLPPTEVGHQLGIHADFAIRKVLDQANRHTTTELDRAFRRLLAADVAIKRGRLDDEPALELAIMELCPPSP